MSCVEDDRRELLGRLILTQTDYHKMSGLPPVMRNDVMGAAFNACADIGFFNRKNPTAKIFPIPGIDMRDDY